MGDILRFRFDSTSSASRINTRTVEATFNPPGYSSSAHTLQHHADSTESSERQEHLIRKRAWEVAMAPAKSIPMNMFMMYMAGRTVSIFPMMMVAMMLWRPIKALLSVGAAFDSMQEQHGGSLVLHKLVFILGNLGTIALALYKVHGMGLLPNTPSDWLEFIAPAHRLQYSINSPIFA